MNSVTTQPADPGKPFVELWNALQPREQRKVLKKSMRREANRLKHTAEAELQRSGLGSGTRNRVKKGIRVRVFSRGGDFMVTVKPRGARGIHTNRYGQKKPVLMFAEDGTDYRRRGKRSGSFFGRSRYTGKRYRRYARTGGRTGRMKAYHFLRNTETNEAGRVADNLWRELRAGLEKAVDNL